MKKLIAAFCVVSAAAAFADEATDYQTTGNTFGVLRVTSSAVRTIVAVPWLEPSTGADDVHITNIVKTADLNTGDRVCYYDVAKKSFKLWQLTSDKKWESAANVSDDTNVTVTDKETLKRGNAFILMRNDPGDHFCIQGQAPASSSTVKVELASGPNGVFNLIAPPTAAAFDPNTDATWSNIDRLDMLVIEEGGGKNIHCYWCDENGKSQGTMKWRYLKTNTETLGGETVESKTRELAPTVKVGQGFWFVGYGTDKPTVQW